MLRPRPQLIARIHAPSANVRRLIHQLLSDVGKEHPQVAPARPRAPRPPPGRPAARCRALTIVRGQALIYPLTVASKSQSSARRNAALAILDKMRQVRARPAAGLGRRPTVAVVSLVSPACGA